jgi:DNA-binding transcriptional ArsR family regulator
MEKQLPHQHGVKLNFILKDLPDNADFSAVADMFSSVSDTVRLKLFWLLCHYEECVINLSALMEMSSPAISHHLKVLKKANLITSRRVGKEMYYKATETEASRLLHHMIEMMIDITCPKEK